MRYTLTLSVEALQEETVAYNYYEDIQTGLGDRFLIELEKGYDKIADNPVYYSYLQSSRIIRSLKIAHYPYIIAYLVSAKNIVVISIKNTHTKPFFE